MIPMGLQISNPNVEGKHKQPKVQMKSLAARTEVLGDRRGGACFREGHDVEILLAPEGEGLLGRVVL